MLTNLSAEGQFRPVGGFAEPVVGMVVQRNRDTFAGVWTQIHRHLLVFISVAYLLYLLGQHCVAVNASNQREIAFAALRRDNDVQRRDVFRQIQRAGKNRACFLVQRMRPQNMLAARMVFHIARRHVRSVRRCLPAWKQDINDILHTFRRIIPPLHMGDERGMQFYSDLGHFFFRKHRIGNGSRIPARLIWRRRRLHDGNHHRPAILHATAVRLQKRHREFFADSHEIVHAVFREPELALSVKLADKPFI